jgi:hypothetical protein
MKFLYRMWNGYDRYAPQQITAPKLSARLT